jgi:hypothetical protein
LLWLNHIISKKLLLRNQNRQKWNHGGFESHTAVVKKGPVSCDITSFSPVKVNITGEYIRMMKMETI